MTGYAPLGLHRRVLVGEWTLFICVALDTRCVPTRSQPSLFDLKAAVGIVTVATLHHAFEDFMVKRLVEVGLYLTMTAHTQLGLSKLQHIDGCEAGFLSVRRSNKSD